jgi:hypothetical protein
MGGRGGGGGADLRLIGGLAGFGSSGSNRRVQCRRGISVGAADEHVRGRHGARRCALGSCGRRFSSMRGGCSAALRQLLNLAFEFRKIVVDVTHGNLAHSAEREQLFRRRTRASARAAAAVAVAVAVAAARDAVEMIFFFLLIEKYVSVVYNHNRFSFY